MAAGGGRSGRRPRLGLAPPARGRKRPAGRVLHRDRTAPAANLARYRRESAVCTSGQSNQSRADCLREARSAYAEARRGKLGEGLPADAANVTARCRPLPADDRRDCQARMHGQGTQSGSVASGGVFRELVTIEPATPLTTIVVPSRDPPADRPAPATPEHPPSR